MEKATKLTNSQLKDPVIEEIQEQSYIDSEKADEAVDGFVEVIQNSLNKGDGFNTKHAFLALGKTIVYLSQSLCKDQEHFEHEVNKATDLFVDKMMPSIMPTIQDGKIVDKDFDREDISFRRVIMAIGCAVDYTIWRDNLSSYQMRRAEIEKSEELQNA